MGTLVPKIVRDLHFPARSNHGHVLDLPKASAVTEQKAREVGARERREAKGIQIFGLAPKVQ